MKAKILHETKLNVLRKEGHSFIIISRMIQKNFLSALEFQNMFLRKKSVGTTEL